MARESQLWVSYGYREESVEQVASMVGRMFEVLESVGGPLAGPWELVTVTADGLDNAGMVTIPIDLAVIQEMVYKCGCGPDGAPDPLGGFYLVFCTARRPGEDLAWEGVFIVVEANLGSGQASGMSISGMRGQAPEQLAARGRELVAGLARATGADQVTLVSDGRDKYVLNLAHEDWIDSRDDPSAAREYPMWGYMSWLIKDSVADNVNLPGVTVVDDGPGRILELDTRDPDQAAALWRSMIDDGLIRPLPMVQKNLPIFDPEILPLAG